MTTQSLVLEIKELIEQQGELMCAAARHRSNHRFRLHECVLKQAEALEDRLTSLVALAKLKGITESDIVRFVHGGV